MNYPSIRIEGSILSPDILDRLEDAHGQRPTDFGFDASIKVKDEIVRAWADAQDYWRIFQRKLETVKADSPATTETRSLWVVPFLSLLGYELEYQQKSVELNGKTYAISHRLSNRGRTPIHVVGYHEKAGLDRKPEKAVLRMSAHGMVQEYLNLTDGLYGIVTNGRVIRLLRDSSRLVKLTYLEFDLDRILSDGLFADFAVLYRLLHATRLPLSPDAAAECIIERYHQDSLDDGARIRDGLSRAVELAIRDFANGFLAHPANEDLRQAVTSGELKPENYYQHLLRLIYRLLFLMVIEERDLVFSSKSVAGKRDIYDRYYSLQRIRRISEKRHLADRRKNDLWLSLMVTFRLYDAGGPGPKLGIAPLAGDLFSPLAIGHLGRCALGNDILLGCLRSLGLYQHPDTGQLIRVNYAALNVEEFGSVYEGLLEYQPTFVQTEGRIEFAFEQGDERAVTGSHYTPDDLVQPLIKHSLDYLIADKLKEKDPEKALLSLRVADISCGSGHILLAAARRIATELAAVRTGEEQPTPTAFRTAVRDVIRECIYGVDLSPLAVELCKVALWLEAHNPGEPLNFLDHHIKCGNAIVGYARREEVERGVPDEAFITMPGDDKDIAATFRKRNKAERAARKQVVIEYSPEITKHLDTILSRWREVSRLPEYTPQEIEAKKQRYLDFTKSSDALILDQMAAIPIAQFYLSKTSENQPKLITDADFCLYWSGQRHPQGQATAAAWATAHTKRFFHWFLEFPEIIEQGGFDCILGNPPYLGAQKLSRIYGRSYFEWLSYYYSGGGLADLIAYFVRRIFSLVRSEGYFALLSTSSLCRGDSRTVGLAPITSSGGSINFVKRKTKWPGRGAATFVALFAVKKGRYQGIPILDDKKADVISSYFEDDPIGESKPQRLIANINKSFIGSNFNGDGFTVDQQFVERCMSADKKYKDVLFRNLLGRDINSDPKIENSRWIICFFDWDRNRAEQYPLCFTQVETYVQPHRQKNSNKTLQERWWNYERLRKPLYEAIRRMDRVLVRSQAGKHNVFEFVESDYIFDQKVVVFAMDSFLDYAVLNSSVHDIFIWRFSGDLGGTTTNYSPEIVFETFPFPHNYANLETIGNNYHMRRRSIMHRLWLGLTDLYNLFHSSNLTPAIVAKVSGKPEEAEVGYQGILELRQIHRELDEAVLVAYGWNDLNLGHDFYEVETLPENDRVRYTIVPGARKELLKRLLALNHQRAAEEKAIVKPSNSIKRGNKVKIDDTHGDLFK